MRLVQSVRRYEGDEGIEGDDNISVRFFYVVCVESKLRSSERCKLNLIFFFFHLSHLTSIHNKCVRQYVSPRVSLFEWHRSKPIHITPQPMKG